ncbi:iron dicitrate transport regulator FecR [Leptospira langatensis]|uniref:Iron dicitrate transport regulator FecR n=1 Tax=Leptospira langatensis TaxID=2484983 RepID=A0A5F1ZS71_9LEPT|nr:FecR family protein [Leptospira langatensis]TGJ98805.1 iron dicitrate transport regulator FecR [Leptospira langatensis]TGL40628.1 iron dicitrate transport regulator FecR [Leptospira langatensis]
MDWRIYKREWQVGTVCVVILFFSLYLLYYESRAGGGSGKEVMGTVSFRYKTAQRKFPDRMLWEDVEQGMPVFDRDSIRTDEASEAIVFLKSGTKIELDPQSMVVLQLKESKENLDLNEGNILVESGKKVLSVIAGTVGLQAGSDSKFQVTRDKNGTRVIVEKGEVEWNEDGTVKQVLGEKDVAFNANKILTTWNLISPEDSTRYFPSEQEQLVEFHWDGGEDGILEISSKRDFTGPVSKRAVKEMQYKQKFQEGIFYWRIHSKDGKRISEVRKFRVLPNFPVELQYPKKDLTQEDRTVSFAWVKQKIASGYKLQISKDPNFTSVVETQLFRTNFSLTLSPGTYYWRIQSYTNLPGTETFSEARKFSISLPQEQVAVKAETGNGAIPEPQNAAELALEYPKNGALVDMTGKEGITFRWKISAKQKQTEWKFRLFFRKGSSDELIYEKKTKGDRLYFRDLEKLDVGTFHWAVESELEPNLRSEADFKIQLREDLAAPETKASGARH